MTATKRNGRVAFSSRNWRTAGESNDTGRWTWQNRQLEWAHQPPVIVVFADRTDIPALQNFLGALGGAINPLSGEL